MAVLAVAILVVGGCSSEATSNSVWYDTITFRQDYNFPVGPIITSPHTTTTEWIGLTAPQRVISVVAVTRDQLTGGITQTSRWREGQATVAVSGVEGCSSLQEPLPTKPVLDDIINDAIGPLSDFARFGYVRTRPGVYERQTDVTRFVLNASGSLRGRTLTMIDPKTGKVQSTIYDISYTHHKPPVAIPSPVCRSGSSMPTAENLLPTR